MIKLIFKSTLKYKVRYLLLKSQEVSLYKFLGRGGWVYDRQNIRVGR